LLIGLAILLHPQEDGEDQQSMKLAERIVVLVLLAGSLSVAQQLPVGTILPVALSTSIIGEKAKPGERITGKLGQYVIFEGTRLPRGTEVSGRILRVQGGPAGSPARVTFVFDTIRIEQRDVPITTSLRALASMQDVFEAELPTNAIDDYGSTIRDWNTTQVGGQGVYRGDGIVMEGPEVVGKASMVGEVFGTPKTWPWSPCRSDQANTAVQSFWVFSTDACGVYGFDGLTLAHAGRSEPRGEIVLEFPGKLRIRAGSGLLLMVVSGTTQPDAGRANSHEEGWSGSIEVATQR